MSSWIAAELEVIGARHGLQVSPFREDGVTYGTPTWVWGVVVGSDVYARAYSGTASTWYQAAVRQQAGRIRCGRLIRNVTFEPVAGPINDQIDAVYRAKYGSSKYVPEMTGERVRAATVRIIPARPVGTEGSETRGRIER